MVQFAHLEHPDELIVGYRELQVKNFLIGRSYNISPVILLLFQRKYYALMFLFTFSRHW